MKDITFEEWKQFYRGKGITNSWAVSWEWNHNDTLNRCKELKRLGAVAFMHIGQKNMVKPVILGLLEASQFTTHALLWIDNAGYALPLNINSRFDPNLKQAAKWFAEIPRAA